MKRVEHLKDALRGVFADINSAAEHFASRIDDNQLDRVAFTGMRDPPGDLAEHGFIEKVVIRTVERHSCDAVCDAELYMLELFRLAAFRLRCEILGVDRLNHFPRSWASVALMTSENPLVRLDSMLARLRWLAGKGENDGAQKVCWIMGKHPRGKHGGRCAAKEFLLLAVFSLCIREHWIFCDVGPS